MEPHRTSPPCQTGHEATIGTLPEYEVKIEFEYDFNGDEDPLSGGGDPSTSSAAITTGLQVVPVKIEADDTSSTTQIKIIQSPETTHPANTSRISSDDQMEKSETSPKLKCIKSENSNSSEEELKAEVPFKKKRPDLPWIFERKFDNMIQAQEALDEENTWSIHYPRESEDGWKTYYRCNKVLNRGPQCPARKYLLKDSTSETVLMYRKDADHNHKDKILTIHGVSEEVKLEIDKLFALHLKPKSIIKALQKMEGVQLPSMSNLKRYLTDRRRASRKTSTVNLGELEKCLQDNSVLPENPHETFVIGYDIFEDDEAFRFVLSTKYLLELARDVGILHADTTHKLIWQGCTVLTVGTSDKQHKFHSLCLFVSTSSEKEDYQLIFKSMKEKIQLLFSSPFKPTVLVTDSVECIQNAFTEEFEDAKVRVCWSHAKKLIKTRIDRDVNKSVQKQLLEDIETLHSITNRYAFHSACELFLQKYENQKKFITYFKEQWIVQSENWYLGAVPKSPSTNDALGAFNKVVKDRNILRERLQPPRFLLLAKELLNEWSTKYINNPDEHFVAKSYVISLKDWTDSYGWSRKTNAIIVIPCEDKNFTCYQLGGEATICNIFENNPETFDEFKEQFFSKWEVRLPINREEWAQGTCTCPQFFKMYMCEHVIGLSIRLKYTVPPDEARIIYVGPKTKRGRPPKGRPALIL